MKVIIPVDENAETVCVAFARAPFFMVYDTENDQKQILENPAAAVHGGAGIKAAQFAVDLQVDALITVRLGENSAEVLKASAMKIYKSRAADAQGNLDALKAGSLSELTEFHAGYHGRR